MNKQVLLPEPECTNRCTSTRHADIISAAITKRSISDSDLSSFLTYTCCCCESVKDSEGRIALHVAASCGRTDLVRWLVENRHGNINCKDKESGYTSLHRSVFYGKIDVTVELIKLGANLGLQDANGLTYLEHAMVDRFRPPSESYTVKELFTWGSNSNNSLGLQLPRSIPETMDIFHKEYPYESVKSVLIDQFHSVILSDSGVAYSCGHGQGGRLGLGVQHSEVVPKPIKFPASMNQPVSSERLQVISVSIARDHSLFLAAGGEVYACGLNKHKVLGINPPPDELLTPKLLKHDAADSSLVATGTYHSLVWNETGLFTWGLNAGQLGHQLPSKYILTPKRVKCISTSAENPIKVVCCSTGATVVYTKKGDVYILHEYQCRKIASRQLNLIELAVIGGNLNHNLDPELSNNKNRELKVAALTNTGNLLLWQESDSVLRRCIFSINRALNIGQVALNISQLLLVTKDGEAFKGDVKPRKKKLQGADMEKKSDFHKFVDRDECVSVKLERIPRIHRAICIRSDPKGHNFGIVQECPYKYFEYHNASESTMLHNMTQLLLSPDVADVEFSVAGRIYAAHKYVLANRSRYFANILTKNKDAVIELSGVRCPVIFEEFLRYIYTGMSELTRTGELKNESLIKLCARPYQGSKEDDVIIDETQAAFIYYNHSKPSSGQPVSKLDNPVRMLHEMAKRFEVHELQKVLSNLDMVKNCVRVKKGGRELTPPNIFFNKNSYPDLYDVEIVCKGGQTLKAHKCILVARLDYFSNMFSSRWGGEETSRISLSFTREVVDALLEFLYTDSLDRLDEKDIDQLFKIIILADQFFVTRLKDQCENILSNLLTIKNAIQLLAFSDAYNAERVKHNCFEFIQENMTSFLEMRLLDDLESHVLKELSDFYQMRRGLDCRIITPYSTAVSDEHILHVCSLFPVDISEKKEKKAFRSGGSKKRTRSHKNSVSDKHILFENDVVLPDIPGFQEENAVEEVPVSNRIKSILLANELAHVEKINEEFTPLTKDSFRRSFEEFPFLNSPPKVSGFQSRAYSKTETKQKMVKMSQKQRKRLSSESGNVASSSNLSESPKNPWKVLQEPTSPLNSLQSDNFGSIMSSEKKQKENLIKITSKPLLYTQLEDRAIDELNKFYSVECMEDELIVIERVCVGAIAVPVWVPKTK